jgi:LPXTG-motif cell wall-anchored protein
VGIPGSPNLPTTGGAPVLIVLAGVMLVAVGWFARRRTWARLRRAEDAP